MLKKYILFFSAALLLFWGCEERELSPVLSEGGTFTLENPKDGESYVLTEDAAAEVFANFTWTKPEYGFQAAITYTVEIDKSGSNFENAVSLGVTTDQSISDITIEQVNNILLTMGLPADVATQMDLRTVASISSEVAPLFSNTVTINITPYLVEIDYPKLQVPGSYQGWAPEDTTTVIYSVKADNNYEGYVYIPNDNSLYKFTQGLTWDVNWGDDDLDGTLDPNGADIPLVDAGVYKLNVDLNALTHTNQRTDWGLIGDATPGGWDSDQDMTFDPETGIWSITLDLVAGAIKFRANDDWALNFGDTGPNFFMEYDGDNIAITEAGNYTIELILNVPRYTYTVTKN